MTCKLGQSMTNQVCPYDVKGLPTRKRCHACKEYEAPKYIQSWCLLWANDKTVCLKPRADCDTCPEQQIPEYRGNGLFDMADPFEAAMANAARQAKYRKENPIAAKETREEFLARHPEYYKQYMRSYRERKKKSKNAPKIASFDDIE